MLTAMVVPVASANNQGWVREGTTWFYIDSNGNRLSNGPFEINGTWYYFHENGAMATGWIRLDTRWYFFHTNGARASGSGT